MSTGLDQLKHIVVLMMENRSFDHMLGSLKAIDSRIDGVTDQLSNPDTTGASVKPQPLAEFQGQLNPDPDHHFPAVDLQIFGGDASPTRAPNMHGFVKSYFSQRRDVEHSQKIMYYFNRVTCRCLARWPWSLRFLTGGSHRFRGPRSATSRLRTMGRRSAEWI